jgi:hypothetical protein
MNIGATIYDAKNALSAKIAAHIKREVSLPSAPFVGMSIVTENDWWNVKEVRWHIPKLQFFLVLEEKFKEADIEGIGFTSFQGWLDKLTQDGWNCSKPFDVQQS